MGEALIGSNGRGSHARNTRGGSILRREMMEEGSCYGIGMGWLLWNRDGLIVME